jgi:hypothetical protein
MPRKPIEWSKCIIYKIWKDDDFYVGSTTDFVKRQYHHKQSCNNEKRNFKIYQMIREKGGWIAWQMIPLEEYKECQTQVQARIREEEWRVKLNAQLNMIRAFIDEEQQKEKKKQYQQEHKEEILKYKKQYQQEHKEEIKIKLKEYYENHKEERLEYQKQWYQDNANKIKEKRNQKFKCNCGGKYTQSNKVRHEESIKHQTYLATN